MEDHLRLGWPASNHRLAQTRNVLTETDSESLESGTRRESLLLHGMGWIVRLRQSKVESETGCDGCLSTIRIDVPFVLGTDLEPRIPRKVSIHTSGDLTGNVAFATRHNNLLRRHLSGTLDDSMLSMQFI